MHLRCSRTSSLHNFDRISSNWLLLVTAHERRLVWDTKLGDTLGIGTMYGGETLIHALLRSYSESNPVTHCFGIESSDVESLWAIAQLTIQFLVGSKSRCMSAMLKNRHCTTFDRIWSNCLLLITAHERSLVWDIKPGDTVGTELTVIHYRWYIRYRYIFLRRKSNSVSRFDCTMLLLIDFEVKCRCTRPVTDQKFI